MHLSRRNSSVRFTWLHDAIQLVLIRRRVPGGEQTEGGGDEFVLENDGKPCGEEDKRGGPDHSNGCVEDEENLGGEKSNTPEEHGFGEAEKEGQVLEPVGIVPAFGKVRILWRK